MLVTFLPQVQGQAPMAATSLEPQREEGLRAGMATPRPSWSMHKRTPAWVGCEGQLHQAAGARQ